MIEVEIEDQAWTEALPDAAAIAERAALAVLLLPHSEGNGGGGPLAEEPMVRGAGPRTGVAARPHHLSPAVFATEELNVTVLLTDDEAVRELNARFRGKDQPTNVLSFPAPESARPHLGDVALAHGVCAREAAAQGKRLEDHLMHLAAHGVLHLLGYDHQTDAEAEAMEALERRILQGLGAPDPYGVEVEADGR